MDRAIGFCRSARRRLGLSEAKAFPPGGAREPNLVTVDLFDPVAFDHVAFGKDALVDGGEPVAGLPPSITSPSAKMPWLMAASRLPVCRQMALSFQWLTGETRACAASGGTGGEKRNGSRAGDSTHWAKCDCT